VLEQAAVEVWVEVSEREVSVEVLVVSDREVSVEVVSGVDLEMTLQGRR